MVYFATFIPGLEKLTEEVIRERLADVSIQRLMEGAIIFQTAASYDRLNFFCFNNIFLLMDLRNSGQAGGPELLENHLRHILDRKKTWPEMGGNNKQIKTFRLFCSLENKPISIDEKLKKNMEAHIARSSGLGVNRARPDTEFWVLSRREGFSCFMKRLTNNRAGEKALHPGELSPQLAWALCRLARLRHNETAVDPFAGYGAIPLAACRHFPIKIIYASDLDPRCVKFMADRPGLGANKRAEILKLDFRGLPGLVKEKVNVIITDPPWGMYQSGISLGQMYDEMLKIFAGLLEKGGRAVILSAALAEMEEAAKKTADLCVQERVPILVSGKKAMIFILNYQG